MHYCWVIHYYTVMLRGKSTARGIRAERQTNCTGPGVRSLLVVFLTCYGCAAQSIAVGVIGGGRLTDDVSLFPSPEANVAGAEAAFKLESRFYDVGPMIEIGITHGFAVEFDALYHRQGFFSAFYHDTAYYTSRERDNSWEFPLLLKYKLAIFGPSSFCQSRSCAGHD
jgi:hypothetical protein